MNAKSIVTIFFCLLTALVVNPNQSKAQFEPEDILTIEPIRRRSTTIQELKDRIWMLERAVAQLQNKVFALSKKQAPKTKPYTCYIKVFSKTFSATHASKMKAKVDVIKECTTKNSSIHCDEDEVKCSND